jgi:hypothetical protein
VIRVHAATDIAPMAHIQSSGNFPIANAPGEPVDIDGLPVNPSGPVAIALDMSGPQPTSAVRIELDPTLEPFRLKRLPDRSPYRSNRPPHLTALRLEGGR